MLEYKHVITGETKSLMELWDIAATVVLEKEKAGQWGQSAYKETHKELALMVAREWEKS